MSPNILIYFQARSVRISEQQLKVNVDDVKTLSLETKSIADQIRKEREIREEMVLKRMEEFAEQMNYTSHVYDKAMYFYRTSMISFVKGKTEVSPDLPD